MQSMDRSIHGDDSVTLSNSENIALKQNTENMDSTLLTGTENEKDTTVGGNQRNSGIGNRLSSAFRLKSRGLTTPSMDQSIHSDDSVTLSNLETNELKQNTEKMDSTLVTPKRAIKASKPREFTNWLPHLRYMNQIKQLSAATERFHQCILLLLLLSVLQMEMLI